MISVVHLIKKMPEGYEEACYTEKAIQRKRGITDPNDLMMLSLFHLLNGCSLTEISLIAELTKLGSLSDVAFMKRFQNCNDWFLWILSNLVTNGAIPYQKPAWLEAYNVLGVDASDVKEKGRSGRIYRLHFALDIFKMQSAQYKITTNKTGETLCNFEVKPNDLLVADRGYVGIRGIEHCLNGGGNVILRLRKNSFSVYNSNGKKINLLDKLNGLEDEQTLDLDVHAKGSNGSKIPLRICAKRKTPEAVARAKKKMRRDEQRSQSKMAADTKVFNEYIVLATSLPGGTSTAEQILELYRFRWQIEMYFKRLKSIMDFGELPKHNPKSVMAWLNGKLMIAILIEKIVGETVFPPSGEYEEELMEGDKIDIPAINHQLC